MLKWIILNILYEITIFEKYMEYFFVQRKIIFFLYIYFLYYYLYRAIKIIISVINITNGAVYQVLCLFTYVHMWSWYTNFGILTPNIHQYFVRIFASPLQEFEVKSSPKFVNYFLFKNKYNL